MSKPGFLILLIFCFPTGILSAQNNISDESFLFSDKEVARIDITINPDSLSAILGGDYWSDHEYPADFTMTRGVTIKTVHNVGFRLRGNTSRNSDKKSFKISINSFTPGKSFEGVEKINLNGEHNDPSISRAKICWDLFRETGIPAPRSNHVQLYINTEYRGLYLNVEHIDEQFVNNHFQNNDGNLYKCLWPADLKYLGPNAEQYKFISEGRRAYELTRNKDKDDYSDLLNFIDKLNNTPDAQLPGELEQVFNINSYLKSLVIEILTGHWDSYSFNKNNFYLYHNLISGKMEYIPYDADNTFGIDWFGIDWASRNIYNWSNTGESRPLYEKTLQNKLYRDRFSFYMERMLNTYFLPGNIEPGILELRDKISPFAVDDIYMTMDYNYSYEDFYNSFESATGGHVKYGIIPFIETRYASARNQFVTVDIAPIISNVYCNLDINAENISITALIEDEDSNPEVTLYYNTGAGINEIKMESSTGEIYRAQIPLNIPTSGLNYYILAEDLSSQVSREPITGEYFFQFLTESNGYMADTDILKVYPNPFNSYLKFFIPENFESIVFTISDLSGKIIYTGETKQTEIFIPESASKFHDGLYIIRLDGLNRLNEITFTSHQKLVYQAY